MDSIYRYWLVPSSLRRRSRPVRLCVVLGCALLSVWLMTIPLEVWLPRKTWEGWDGFTAELLYMAFLLVLSVFLLCAGALTIAPERDRQTWESLIVAPFGVPSIVRAKLFARILRCAGFLLILVPFFVAWAYEVLTINGVGPADPKSPLRDTRLTIYLCWLGARLIGHILPFVSIGVLISSFCRRSRTALSLAITSMIGYVALIWGLSSPPLANYFTGISAEVAGQICLWPWSPPYYYNYETGWLISNQWTFDAAGDAVWLIIIPIACYFISVRRCKRSIAQ